MRPADPFANCGSLSVRSLFVHLERLAESLESVAGFNLTSPAERTAAKARERDVRAAIESRDVRLTFLAGGAIVASFGKGEGRWCWAWDDADLGDELTDEEVDQLERDTPQ